MCEDNEWDEKRKKKKKACILFCLEDTRGGYPSEALEGSCSWGAYLRVKPKRLLIVPQSIVVFFFLNRYQVGVRSWIWCDTSIARSVVRVICGPMEGVRSVYEEDKA